MRVTWPNQRGDNFRQYADAPCSARVASKVRGSPDVRAPLDLAAFKGVRQNGTPFDRCHFQFASEPLVVSALASWSVCLTASAAGAMKSFPHNQCPPPPPPSSPVSLSFLYEHGKLYRARCAQIGVFFRCGRQKPERPRQRPRVDFPS